MTEFAYSGIGMNPHYGDPRSPFERDIDGGRVSGGSSSGALYPLPMAWPMPQSEVTLVGLHEPQRRSVALSA